MAAIFRSIAAPAAISARAATETAVADNILTSHQSLRLVETASGVRADFIDMLPANRGTMTRAIDRGRRHSLRDPESCYPQEAPPLGRTHRWRVLTAATRFSPAHHDHGLPRKS